MLDMACECTARTIQGQLENSIQDFCEEAWAIRHKTEEHPHGVGGEEWYAMRHSLESLLAQIKKLCWGLDGGWYNGIGYDDTADVLWDMHKACEHARYLAMPPEKQESMRYTVMADSLVAWGKEPVMEVEEKK